jgi:hypothetical protein
VSLGVLPHVNATLTQIRPAAADDGYRAAAAAPAKWSGHVDVLVDQRQELVVTKGDENRRAPATLAIDVGDVDPALVATGDLVTFALDGGAPQTLKVRCRLDVDAVGLLQLELMEA